MAEYRKSATATTWPYVFVVDVTDVVSRMVYGERKYNLLCRVVAYYPTSLDGRFIVELSHMAEKGVRRQLSMDTFRLFSFEVTRRP